MKYSPRTMRRMASSPGSFERFVTISVPLSQLKFKLSCVMIWFPAGRVALGSPLALAKLTCQKLRTQSVMNPVRTSSNVGFGWFRIEGLLYSILLMRRLNRTLGKAKFQASGLRKDSSPSLDLNLQPK